ncbi:hypothetical protein IAU60_004711 [Kwoniella sp. DSM 27419]
MSLLSGTVQPSLLVLLSSTSSPPLSPLFRRVTDGKADAIITSLPDTDSAQGSSSRRVPHTTPRGSIVHHVVHIQSPDPRRAYIQAGCMNVDKGKARDDGGAPLGVELPWLGLQLKTLGRRSLSLEVGVVDSRGRESVIRLSTFKTNPTVHPHRQIPLIHLPLQLPASSSSRLTEWVDVTVNLSQLLPLFQVLPRSREQAADNTGSEAPARKRRKVAELPGGGFQSVSYVRVYANCRVKRIWFSAEGERTIEGMGRAAQEGWELYAADQEP